MWKVGSWNLSFWKYSHLLWFKILSERQNIGCSDHSSQRTEDLELWSELRDKDWFITQCRCSLTIGMKSVQRKYFYCVSLQSKNFRIWTTLIFLYHLTWPEIGMTLEYSRFFICGDSYSWKKILIWQFFFTSGNMECIRQLVLLWVLTNDVNIHLYIDWNSNEVPTARWKWISPRCWLGSFHRRT